LAAAQIGRRPLLQIAEPYQFENSLNPFTHFAARSPGDSQREPDIAGDGHMRPNRIGLEHHADVPFLWLDEDVADAVVDDVIADCDLSGGRYLQAGNATQRRRLSTSARTEERHRAARFDLKAHVVDSDEVAKALCQIADANRHTVALEDRVAAVVCRGPRLLTAAVWLRRFRMLF